jgi:hypothetical protein
MPRPARYVLIGALSGLLALAACVGRGAAPPASEAEAVDKATAPATAPTKATTAAKAEDVPYREVTLLGVVATPGKSAVDPKLEEVGMVPQLRQFLDDCSKCGMQLLGAETKERLKTRQSLSLALADGYSASAELLDPRDPEGKVRLLFTLSEGDHPRYEVTVATPPNQPFFCDKQLPDGRRLFLMVGAQ